MAIKKHIKELEARLAHLEIEPVRYWVGKIVKRVKVRRIEKKLLELYKSYKNGNIKKGN